MVVAVVMGEIVISVVVVFFFVFLFCSGREGDFLFLFLLERDWNFYLLGHQCAHESGD